MPARLDWSDGAAGVLLADGRHLEYRCDGPSPREAGTILLLHEGLGCVALWRDFPARLVEATGYGVFTWSRAGYGRSDPVDLPRPLDYMTHEAAVVLPAVLEAVGVQRAILFGHSDGASIAAIHAGRVRDPRVAGLILMAPHFFTEPAGLAAIGEARIAYEAADSELRRRLARHHRDVDVAFRGWNDAWLDPGFVDWNIADCLDTLSVPTLVIQGVDDQYGTARQVDEVVARSAAAVRVAMLADCRHTPQRDQPGATLAAIQAFVRELVAGNTWP